MSFVERILERRVSRRAVIGAAAASSALATIPLPAHAADTTGEIELVEKTFAIRNLPKAFEGYKIGFLADIHLSINVPVEWLERSLKMLTSKSMDLLLLGGDYVAMNDSALSHLLERRRNVEMAHHHAREHPALAYTQLAQTVERYMPVDGVLAVYGNHDRWVAPHLCASILPGVGIKLLVNEAHIIWRGNSHLLVYGTDDYWNGVPSLQSFALLTRRRQDDVRILLTHNPDFTSSLLMRNDSQFDLTLSGHTHGGQIKLPLIGAPFYNIEDLRLAEGAFIAPNGVQCYTTRGVGVIEIPYRINCPAEATMITLRAA